MRVRTLVAVMASAVAMSVPSVARGDLPIV